VLCLNQIGSHCWGGEREFNLIEEKVMIFGYVVDIGFNRLGEMSPF